MSLSPKLRKVKNILESHDWPVSINLEKDVVILKLREDSNHPWIEIYFLERGGVLCARTIGAIDIPKGKELEAMVAVNKENIDSPYLRCVVIMEHRWIDLIYDFLDSTEENFEESIVEVALVFLSAIDDLDSIKEDLYDMTPKGKTSSSSIDTPNKVSTQGNSEAKKGNESSVIESIKTAFAEAQYTILKLCASFMEEYSEDYEKESNKLILGLNIDEDDREFVYLCHDDTIFKSGKNGFAITIGGIYCKELMGRITKTTFEEIANAKRIYWKTDDTLYADQNLIAYKITKRKRESQNLISLFEDIGTTWKKLEQTTNDLKHQAK